MNRGHNRDRVFDEDSDCEIFLNIVRKASERRDLDVHGFALMRNHFHLLVTPNSTDSISKALGESEARYARYYNRKHKRIGSVWNARYNPVPIETEWQWLVCLRYIELNPVRAGIVNDPAEGRWTSYAVHATGSASYPWLAGHSVLEGLAATPRDRHAFYRALCTAPLSEAELTVARDPMCAKLVAAG